MNSLIWGSLPLQLTGSNIQHILPLNNFWSHPQVVIGGIEIFWPFLILQAWTHPLHNTGIDLEKNLRLSQGYKVTNYPLKPQCSISVQRHTVPHRISLQFWSHDNRWPEPGDMCPQMSTNVVQMSRPQTKKASRDSWVCVCTHYMNVDGRSFLGRQQKKWQHDSKYDIDNTKKSWAPYDPSPQLTAAQPTPRLWQV